MHANPAHHDNERKLGMSLMYKTMYSKRLNTNKLAQKLIAVCEASPVAWAINTAAANAGKISNEFC